MKRSVLVISLFAAVTAFAQSPQWSPAAAHEWYIRQPWIVGSNYIQSNTVNQIEMWQSPAFDGDRIDLEFGWAEAAGINTLRVSLNDLVWQHDSGGFESKIKKLLNLAEKHKMKVIFVLFDSLGDPYPDPGTQRQPKAGVRNSLWVQSPGAKALKDRDEMLKALVYAQQLVAEFSIDKRVLAWDVWNEPDNTNEGRYSRSEPPDKVELIRKILPEAFRYVRAGVPTQPVTSGLWHGDWSSPDKLSPIEKIQVELSDFISFQNYDGPAEFEKRVKWLQAFGRPIVCTGMLDRANGSTFEAILPIAVKNEVGVLAGDLVEGKPQMYLPWDSWENPYIGDRKPAVWRQDIFTRTGPAYNQQEVDFIKKMVAEAPKPVTTKPPKSKNGK